MGIKGVAGSPGGGGLGIRFVPGASKSKNRAGAAPGAKWESNGGCALPPQVGRWGSQRNGHL